MYISIWKIKVNGRSEEFSTETSNVHEALEIYRDYFENKYPDKAFNFDSLQRLTGMELLTQ